MSMEAQQVNSETVMAGLAAVIRETLKSASVPLTFGLVIYEESDPTKIGFIGSSPNPGSMVTALRSLADRLDKGEAEQLRVTVETVEVGQCDCPACTANRANGVKSEALH